MAVRRFNARPNTDYSTASPLAFDRSDPGGRELKFYLCDTFVELPVSMNTGDQAYVISNNTFWIATSPTVWGAIGPGVGSALTIQEEDGVPLDAAVTKIRFPNGSLVVNGAGDLSVSFTGSVGPTGASGPPGADGEPGEEGPMGMPGVRGADGATGAPGATGAQGVPGVDGQDGADGMDGLPGATGPQGIQGTAGTAGTAGVPGQDGHDGEDGVPGPPGVAGVAGAAGATGAQGVQGTPGQDGQDGADGADGIPGATGATGAASTIPGPAGPPGANGADGDEGPMGPPGATGATGPAGSSGSATTVEKDLGSVATWRGKFTLTDASIGASSKVLVWQAPGPYTGKGTRGDEAEMQPVNVVAVIPAAGSATVHWETPAYVTMQLQTQQGRFNPVGATFDRLDNQREPAELIPVRIGKVRGNVKFTYLIFA